MMLKVPGIANWRVTHANVNMVRVSNDALCDGVTARNDEVVTRNVKLFNRQRHQRQVMTVFCSCERKSLDKGRPNWLVQNAKSIGWRQKIYQTKQIGVRKTLQHLFQNTLRARVGHHPLVSQGNS